MKKYNLLAGAMLAVFVVVLPQGFALAKTKVKIKTKTPAQTQVQASTANWGGTTIFDGYGSVTWNPATQMLAMAPMASTQPGETHSALTVSNVSVHQPFQLNYTMKTVSQLRTGSAPNAWEVGWLVFGYKDTGAFKYIILKPAGYGVEMGESLLNNKQDFLYTSNFGQDMFPINTNYNVTLDVANNVITMTINGKKTMQYTMSAKDVLTADGKYGFYTEDASIQVSNISMVQR